MWVGAVAVRRRGLTRKKLTKRKQKAAQDAAKIKALEPNGPLKPAIIEKIQRQFGDDPSRWRREMEAEWAEDEDVWLPQSLIVAYNDGKLGNVYVDCIRIGNPP